MSNQNNKIWILGDAVVDLIPDGDNHYLRCPGGAPANVAVGVSRLGNTCGFIGKVGLDPFGKFMQQTLQKEKIDTKYMSLDQRYRTSTVLVNLDENGERDFVFMVRPSADQFLENSDLPVFAAGQTLHCCSIALANNPSRATTLHAMHNMKAVGGTVSFDPNLRNCLWDSSDTMREISLQAVEIADVLKFSEEELMFLMQRDNLDVAFAKITKMYPHKLIIVTLGALGSRYHFQGQDTIVEGIKVTPVDTTGAGDAFVSGLLYGLTQVEPTNWHTCDLDLIIKRANICGALATTAKGAMDALPTSLQLEQWLQ